MSEAAILSVDRVSKRYASYRSNLARFASWFGLPAEVASEYWAVRDVSFDLAPGQAIGLIGQNGAGKSTMLKLVTGTVRPTSGTVRVNGVVRSIIELGLGFNPELTGRENVRQAGGLLGHSPSEIERLLPEVEDFAEIGEFMDQPFRVYSSGMQARLAFSLVTARRPDILIIDEVLAVGDAYFQHKSYARIRDFKSAGSAILLVTHGIADVRSLCDRALLLDRGCVLKDGPPDEVVDYYNALTAAKEASALTVEQRRQANGWLRTQSGTGEVVAVAMSISDAATGREIEAAEIGQDLVFSVRTLANQFVAMLIVGVMLRDRAGHVVWGSNTWHTHQAEKSISPGERIAFSWRFRCDLGQGSYSISYALAAAETHTAGNFEWVDNAVVFEVVNTRRPVFAGSSALESSFSIERSKDGR